jgi:hypothetical protein
MPAVVDTVRNELPGAADAYVTHAGWDVVPLAGPRVELADDCAHPAMAGLYGAGRWNRLGAETGIGRLMLAGGEVARRVIRAMAERPRAAAAAPVRHELVPEGRETDVLVAGGGTAGALAALAAAREGVRTTVLEQSTMLGGIGTGGNISGYYHGCTGGLQDEIDERVAHLSGVFCPAERLPGHRFHPLVKAVVLDEMVREAGVDVLYGATLTAVETEPTGDPAPDGSRRRAPTVAHTSSPRGRTAWSADAYLDCTGDGDLAAQAGAQCRLGRAGDGRPHCYSQSATVLRDGQVAHTNFDAGHVDPTSSEDLTRARREAVAQYLSEDLNKKARLLEIAPLIGLRQSRQIVGDYTLTLGDQARRRTFDDVIGYAYSHYDNHATDYENEDDEAILWTWLGHNWRRPIGCEIPYRCLLPNNLERVLVACRALSLTQNAHYQLRMERDMQRIGEAAGIAAALSVVHACTVRGVPLDELQRKLFVAGALGPADADRTPQSPVVLHAPDCMPQAIPDRSPEQWADALKGEQAADAAWALTQEGEAALPVLLEAIDSGDEHEQFWASVALSMLRRPEGAPALVRAVRTRRDNEPEDQPRTAPDWIAALALLGRTDHPDAARAAAEVLENPHTPLRGCVAALHTLARLGDPAGIPAVRTFLRRERIASGEPIAVPLARGTLKEDIRWNVELSAAEALARMGASPDPALITPHVDDDRAPVRRRAQQVAELVGT